MIVNACSLLLVLVERWYTLGNFDGHSLPITRLTVEAKEALFDASLISRRLRAKCVKLVLSAIDDLTVPEVDF